jgi:hypothetical protein
MNKPLLILLAGVLFILYTLIWFFTWPWYKISYKHFLEIIYK